MNSMQNEDQAWISYREKFSDVYDESNYSSLLQSSVMHASHKLLEKAFDDKTHFARVLEVGAGTGGHLPFVRHSFDQYTLTDLDPKTLTVAERKLTHLAKGKVSYETQIGSRLSYPDNTFDRVVATHVLEHIVHPHLAIKEWCRVLKHGGVLSILIPTDPGIAWRIGRHFGPRKRALAEGIAYDYVMAREHVNSCNNLVALLRHYFPNSKEAWWPFQISSMDLNLFFACHSSINKKSDPQ